MSPHTCHADGCTTVVPRKLFMCKRHWFMLPQSMRDAVWAAYTPGQETLRVMPTDAYFAATFAAIDYVRDAMKDEEGKA